MTSTPLVSCIMPTRNRRNFVGQAIWYFLRQDYSSKELIIVDDGEDTISDLVPNDERIHYVHLLQRRSLGTKRNFACEQSQGELIAHWDDDVWMSPNRLTYQVEQLLTSKADISYARELLYYEPTAGAAWCYHSPTEQGLGVIGCTLLYRRSIWLTHPFPEIEKRREIQPFISSLLSEQIHTTPDSSFCVALIHSRHGGVLNPSDSSWEQRPLEEIIKRLIPDWSFYAALRNKSTSLSPRSDQSSLAGITVCAPFMIYDGYGSIAEYLVLGMIRAGASVNILPLSMDLTGMSEELKSIARRSQINPKAPVLYYCWPNEGLEQFQSASDLFINTMWESSQLPVGWASRLNQARAVIVPTQFVARICHEAGVTVPIEVVPEGIDPDVYPYLDRPERPNITTLVVGTVVTRKNVHEAIAAWKLAFSDVSEARLLIKARFNYGNYVPDDPRISFTDNNETSRGIASWYQQADILLALGNEGFGLPLVEGMATGLPVIALDSEGQADVCEEARDYLLPVKPAYWKEYNEAPFGSAGVRGIPDVFKVAERLRWIATHQEEAKAMGQAASKWVHQHLNIWAKGPAILDVIERYSQSSKPFRRSRIVWIPSWGTACGLAEYTASLAQSLPKLRIMQQPPNVGELRLLHIQHEDSLFNDFKLTRHLQQVHQRRVPIVVTEHSVSPQMRPWEQYADALVALTPLGAEQLRSRWPSKSIHYIPHGCPTWFPPRKSSRGLVIGAFGFLEKHKGFWQLLDIIKSLPGTKLILFSYTKSTTHEREWHEAIQELPVRWINQFLPASEIARRLAAKADILVFWYDEVPHFSASGAVRVGLATGVPVLTSPTSWFCDLCQVTYQPKDLIQGVQRLLEDTELRTRIIAAALNYCYDNSWSRSAKRHSKLWQSLEKS